MRDRDTSQAPGAGLASLLENLDEKKAPTLVGATVRHRRKPMQGTVTGFTRMTTWTAGDVAEAWFVVVRPEGHHATVTLQPKDLYVHSLRA